MLATPTPLILGSFCTWLQAHATHIRPEATESKCPAGRGRYLGRGLGPALRLGTGQCCVGRLVKDEYTEEGGSGGSGAERGEVMGVLREVGWDFDG